MSIRSKSHLSTCIAKEIPSGSIEAIEPIDSNRVKIANKLCQSPASDARQKRVRNASETRHGPDGKRRVEAGGMSPRLGRGGGGWVKFNSI